jgi:hypothetical protein
MEEAQLDTHSQNYQDSRLNIADSRSSRRILDSELGAEAHFQDEDDCARAQDVPEDGHAVQEQMTGEHKVGPSCMPTCLYQLIGAMLQIHGLDFERPIQFPLPLPKDIHGNDIPPAQGLWDAIQKGDDDMCKGLKEDYIDTLLVLVSSLS